MQQLALHTAPVLTRCYRAMEEITLPLETNNRRARLNLAQDVLRSPLPRGVYGFCSGCREFVDMDASARHGSIDQATGSINFAYSETFVCPTCRISSRMRFAVDVLEAAALPSGASVYITENKTKLSECLQKKEVMLQASEFLSRDALPGAERDGTRHEDLHALTFQRDSFEMVICLDVLEHVEDPMTCLSELHRVLKTGALGVVTFPFFDRLPRTRVRAKYVDGVLSNVEAPVFHSDWHGGQNLVFHDFGWDFVERALAAFPGSVFVDYWSPSRAHHGPFRPCLLLAK